MKSSYESLIEEQQNPDIYNQASFTVTELKFVPIFYAYSEQSTNEHGIGEAVQSTSGHVCVNLIPAFRNYSPHVGHDLLAPKPIV